jgi:2-C-methyl-D-erythritol 4-phosphate cytidylyltransferase
MEVATVICAAGSSTRMGGATGGANSGVKKEYRPLGEQVDADGKPLTVLGAAASVFAAVPRVSLIVIVVPPRAEDGEFAARMSLPAHLLVSDTTPRILFVPGGATRRVSVHHALTLLAAYQPDYVLIHDGARPWVSDTLINRVIDAVLIHKAVIPLLSLVETPKELDEQGFVCRHLKRARVGTAQTPQAFAFPQILIAHDKAAERELRDIRSWRKKGARREVIEYTDDAEVWGEFIGPVAVVVGSPENRKITFPEDLLST